MASGAGSNVVSLYLFTQVNAAGLAAVATPLTAYGVIGVNDSGGYCTEGRAFSKISLQLEPVGATTLTGVTISLYGCFTPAAYQTWFNAIQGYRQPGSMISAFQGTSAVPLPAQGFTNAAGYVPGVAPGAWALLPGPQEQGGTGGIANPVTPATPILTCSLPVVALRAVVTAVAAPAGVFNLAAELIP